MQVLDLAESGIWDDIIDTKIRSSASDGRGRYGSCSVELDQVAAGRRGRENANVLVEKSMGLAGFDIQPLKNHPNLR